MFAIAVELLFGTYRGDPDGTANTGRQVRGEWPPAPSRLLSALVAADGTRDACHVTRLTGGWELAWFERLPAPRIYADARANHQPLHTRYVVKHASGQGIGTSGRARWAQKEYVARAAVPVRQGARVSVRDPRVVYCWDVEPPPVEILAALRRRAARVGYLGAADSPVRLRVGDAAPGPLLAAWEPDGKGDIALGVPRAGDVGVLDRMVDQWRQRGASVARLQFPALHRQARYRSPGGSMSGWATEMRTGEVVAWLRLAEPVSGRRIGAVTGLFKAAVLRSCERLHGDVPAVLHGHGFGASGYEIARFLALPDVGRAEATGRIHELALWLPGVADAETRRNARAAVFGLRRLVGRGLDVGVVAVGGNMPSPAIGAPPWVGPSRCWATAVPAIHERRRPLDIDELWRWCEHAGLPRPLAFREARQPFVAAGLDLAPVAVNRRGRPGLPYSHVELCFAEPVDGPVVLGSGRQRGFGLCIAVDGPLEGRHSAFPGADRRPLGQPKLRVSMST